MKTMLGLVTVGLLTAFATTASAQSLTLRLEGGAAVPLTKPQTEHFTPGFAGAGKVDLGLGSYFSLGPSVSYMVLPSRLTGVDAGTALGLGGFVRLKRPHDENNTGVGLTSFSPWVEGGAGYTRTGGLDRFGWSAEVGGAIPTDDETRWLWVGPFVKYDVTYQEDGHYLNTNTNSAKTLVAGLSFEFGAAMKRKEVPPVQVTSVPVEPEVVPAPKPPTVETPPATTTTVQFQPRIQFAWDSAKLEPDQVEVLKDVIQAMLADKDYTVKISGHASSEGQTEHNNKLAQARADAVLNFLVANGVDRNRMTATGFGSRVPVADNKTEAGRVANRRVEFDVMFTLVKGDK